MLAKATSTIRSTETRQFNGNGCPIEWLWDRVDDEMDVTRQPKSWFERGNVGHAIIEALLEGAEWDDAMLILTEFLESDVMDEDWIETSKCTKANFEYEIIGLIDKFVSQYERLYEDYEVVGTEYELVFDTPNGTVVSTTLDALFKDPDGWPVVVDWKLGTSKSGKDMQLYVYWYGLRRLGLVPDDAWFRGWFHYVTYEDPIGYTHNVAYPGDDFVAAYIDEADKRRKEGPYLPAPDWFSCRYCHHQEVCPLYAEDAEEVWEMIQQIEVRFE